MEDFDIFSLSTKALHTSGLSDGIEAFKATYAFSEMPGPFNHHAADGQQATILWLPKSNDRSVIVASELRQAGFFDMNRHFLSLLNRDRKSTRLNSSH